MTTKVFCVYCRRFGVRTFENSKGSTCCGSCKAILELPPRLRDTKVDAWIESLKRSARA